jgi:hypothetical protein
MYWYLPTVLLFPHVRLRNSRLDASFCEQAIHGLGPQMVGGVTGVWRTWLGLIEIEFRQSSHEFSI